MKNNRYMIIYTVGLIGSCVFLTFGLLCAMFGSPSSREISSCFWAWCAVLLFAWNVNDQIKWEKKREEWAQKEQNKFVSKYNGCNCIVAPNGEVYKREIPARTYRELMEEESKSGNRS